MNKLFKKRYFAFCFIISLSNICYSQFVIQKGSTLSSANSIIAIPVNIINEGASVDLKKSHLVVGGKNQAVATLQALEVGTLEIDGGGSKTLYGTWKILDRLILNEGFIVPGEKAMIAGKIVFTGNDQPNGNPASYVKGKFFSFGNGSRLFPIGTDGKYTPAVLQKAQTETGIEIINASANLLLAQQGNNEILQCAWHWKLSFASPPSSTTIGLSTNYTESFFESIENLDVIAASLPGDLANNLGKNSTDHNFIYSQLPILQKEGIYTLAETTKERLRIHNLITSNNDGVNSSLIIDNVDQFPENKITLIDRWGAIVVTLKNFNTTDTSFDFGRLSPGNYVCIIEYETKSGPKKISQMITVLK
jgi:hypothetical protein